MRPSRRSGPVELGDALNSMLRRVDRTGQLAKRGAEVVWYEVVGENIALHTTVLTCRSGELVVGADSSAWAGELSMMAESLRERVNSALGEESVRSIRFTVSKAVQTDRETEESVETTSRRYGGERVEPQALDSGELAVIESSLEAIGDPELRDIARRATVKDLEWKKGRDITKARQEGTRGLLGPKIADKP